MSQFLYCVHKPVLVLKSPDPKEVPNIVKCYRCNVAWTESEAQPEIILGEIR